MNLRFVSELVDFFRKHHLVDRIDESRIEAAAENPVLGNIMEQLLPEKMLIYDAEYVQSGADFTMLVNEYSALTNGAWNPTNVRSTFNWDENQARIEFDFQQKHFQWVLKQEGDYVGPDFLKTIGEFFESFLEASLINLHFLSQEIYVLYLPRAVAAEFQHLVHDFTPSSDEIADFVNTIVERSGKGKTGWLLVQEVLAQHNLANINQPTRDGKLVLSNVLDKVRQGSRYAEEIIHVLKGLGADPHLLDEKSIQYWHSKWKLWR